MALDVRVGQVGQVEADEVRRPPPARSLPTSILITRLLLPDGVGDRRLG
jgi:hypothetical protein